MNFRHRVGCALFAGICAVVVVGTQAGEKSTVKPEDLIDLYNVSDVRISPDGTRVAFVVEEPADPEKPKTPRDTDIWMVPADGSEPARRFAASDRLERMPRWSPDGRHLAFLTNRDQAAEELDSGEEVKYQIYLLRTDGGEAEKLTGARGGVENLEWSPDGDMIAFTVKDALTEEEEEKRKAGDDEIHVDHDYRYARLWAMKLADRKKEQVTQQDLNVWQFNWSPDAKELAIITSETPRLDDYYMHSKLHVVRRKTGKIVRTLSERMGAFGGEFLIVRWSPDGKTIAFPELTPNKIASRLALIPAGGGKVRHPLDDYQGTVWEVEWTPDSRRLQASTIVGSRVTLIEVDAESGVISDLAEITPKLLASLFSASSDGRTLAYLDSAGNAPEDVWVLAPGAGPRRVTDLNPQARNWRLGEVTEVRWENSKDGHHIYGVLITPPDFTHGRRYPTVVQVHGGPEWAWWSGWHGSWHEWGQLLASNGYVVLLPNPRGSDGQNWRFIEANRADWGGMDFQDIMDGVDYLVEKRIADPERLGIGGWSYGGYMTSWAVTQTDRFKAAIVGAGVTNLFSMYGTSDIPSFLASAFMDIPFRRRAAYDKHSAMTHLSNCTTPSLVVHGERDLRVPAGQGWEFYTGLKSLGVETEMVVYPREPHGFKERAHQLDLLKRVLAWFDGRLKEDAMTREP
jgi:dipeptidyl aminopeptidase/acylaminoacyl peptidase